MLGYLVLDCVYFVDSLLIFVVILVVICVLFRISVMLVVRDLFLVVLKICDRRNGVMFLFVMFCVFVVLVVFWMIGVRVLVVILLVFGMGFVINWLSGRFIFVCII